jgi:hypothetical protein
MDEKRMKHLITINEASQILGRGFSASTIRRGKVKPYQVLPNGTRLYLKSEIEKIKRLKK